MILTVLPMPEPLWKSPVEKVPIISMRRSGGRPALRSTIPFCTSMAQRTASTPLRSSMMLPSPVRFTTRPLWTLMVGAIRSLQSVRSLASVRSSSALASMLYPTTSAARMAVSFRVSAMAVPSPTPD